MNRAIKDYMITSSNLIIKSLTLTDKIHDIIRMMQKCLKSGSKIIVFGNGGSAADSQHFSAELIGRFKQQRKSLPCIALTTDTSSLTAIGNDGGFSNDILDRGS